MPETIFGLLPSGPTPEPGLTHATDHVARAIGVLISQMRNKATFTRLLDIFVRPLQECEDVAWSLLVDRRIDTAVGVQLDVIGKIVKEPRGGLSDTDYRAVLRVKGRVLRSKGTADDLLDVTMLMLQGVPFTYTEFYPASVVINVLGVPPFNLSLLKRFLQKTKMGGVRLDTTHTTSSTTAFRYGISSSLTTSTVTGYDHGNYGASF